MERLTKWNESSHKHAYYPRCFKEPCYGGGCKIKDCPFEIAVCERLAAYEDTGLTPKEVTALGELFDYALKESKTLTEQLTLLHHIRELAEADKDGRVVVLPCKPDGSMLDTSDPERPEIMKRIHFAVAYVCGGIVFHQPYSIFLENVAAGYIRPLNEEAEKALEVE